MADSTLAAVRDLGPLIAAHADEAERERRLARLVVDALIEAGVFRLLLPFDLGGAKPAGILPNGRGRLGRGWRDGLVCNDRRGLRSFRRVVASIGCL